MSFIKVAIKSAKNAGKILLNNFGKINYMRKKDNGFVTNVDLEAERKIINIIKDKYPNHSILSEELGEIVGSDYRWIIDPLDGTHNYIYGLPMFGISIALEYKKVLRLGVIYLPYLNQLFVAEKDSGAYLNGQPIYVSNRELSEAIFLCEGDLKRAKKASLKFMDKIVEHVFRIRVLGAAVINLAFIASGKADAHVCSLTHPWDIAAGFLIVKEAGGKITDFNCKPCDHYTKQYVVSNSVFHADILKLITH